MWSFSPVMISMGPRRGFLLSTFAPVNGLMLAVAAWIGTDREAAAAVGVQQGREHRWRVEPRQAAPVDHPAGRHQRHRVQVAYDGVVLDGRVAVRHDASLEARLPRRADACLRGRQPCIASTVTVREQH